jgi:ABC-type uncharacterized transport system fused permease/ATPase subunit
MTENENTEIDFSKHHGRFIFGQKGAGMSTLLPLLSELWRIYGYPGNRQMKLDEFMKITSN